MHTDDTWFDRIWWAGDEEEMLPRSGDQGLGSTPNSPCSDQTRDDGDGLELPPDHTPKLMDQRGRDFNLSFCVFVFVMI